MWLPERLAIWFSTLVSEMSQIKKRVKKVSRCSGSRRFARGLNNIRVRHGATVGVFVFLHFSMDLFVLAGGKI